MDVLLLSRIQFALTIAFHYLYPPLSIGLGVMLVIMEGAVAQDRQAASTTRWRGSGRKVFALTFAIGVATGIVMEFEFGTNWATYSRYVGDVFGSALAAEGIFAFFLESGFLAVLLFGWDRVGPQDAFLRHLHGVPGRAFQRDLDRGGQFLDADAGGLSHRRRRPEGAGGDHGLLADGVQSVLDGPAVAHAVRRVAGGRVSGGERERVVSAEEADIEEFARASLRVGLVVGTGRRRCCNWSAATAARRAWRKISRPSWRRSRGFTKPPPTRR